MRELKVSASDLPGREYDIAIHFTNAQGLPDAHYIPSAEVIIYAANRYMSRRAWFLKYGEEM